MSAGTLAALAALFGQLSLLAFGGGISVLPEMQRQVSDVHGWMSAADFGALFALSQAAPGPNLMIVTLVGWRVAALPGALVATVAMFLPSSLLTGAMVTVWQRFRHSPWRRRVQSGLLPITAGLIASSAALITVAADTSWPLALVTAAVAGLMLATRLHPLWLLGLGGVAGLLIGA